MSSESKTENQPKFSSESQEQTLMRQSFVGRNLAWLIPSGILVIAAAGIYISGALGVVHMQAPAEASLRALNESEIVAQVIGVPVVIDPEAEITGSFELRYSKEYAKMDRFKVHGPKGSANVYGTMVRTNDRFGWLLWHLAVDFEDGRTIMIPEDGPAVNYVD